MNFKPIAATYGMNTLLEVVFGFSGPENEVELV